MRSRIRSETGTWNFNEIPRSPVKVFFRNVRNCCGSGSSKP